MFRTQYISDFFVAEHYTFWGSKGLALVIVPVLPSPDSTKRNGVTRFSTPHSIAKGKPPLNCFELILNLKEKFNFLCVHDVVI
jgi:hypothetical protein